MSVATKMPSSPLEGLRNHVRMIIAHLEGGDDREALLTAKDLLDSLLGHWGQIVADDPDAPTITQRSLDALLARERKASGQQLADASALAYQQGRTDERRAIAARIVSTLGLNQDVTDAASTP